MRSGSPELEINGAWMVVASRETGYKDASGEVVLAHHIICNDPRINEHISNTSTELSDFAPLLADPPAKGLWFSWCRIIGSGADEWAVEPSDEPWDRLSPTAADALAKGTFTPAARRKVEKCPIQIVGRFIRLTYADPDRSPFWITTQEFTHLEERADGEVQEHTASKRADALHELLSEFHDELEQLLQGRGPLSKPETEPGGAS